MSEIKKADDKKKELYYELKELDEQIKQLNTHLENIDEQLNELNSSKSIVLQLTGLNKGDEMRVPVASGIYIKTSLADNKTFMINVGAGVAVEKNQKEVTEILDKQLKELEDYRENLVAQMKLLIARIEEIQKVFE